MIINKEKQKENIIQDKEVLLYVIRQECGQTLARVRISWI